MQDYKLKKGDIIKLGRIKFKVKDYRADNMPANLDINNQNRRQSCSPMKQGANSNKSQGLGSTAQNFLSQMNLQN